MSITKLSLIALTLTLTGCATYEWYQPGRTPQQRDADILACEREALRMYPQRFESVKVQAAKVMPETRTCTTKGNTQVCITEPEKTIPARYEKQDVNIDQRDNATSLCMSSKGYQWIEVKQKK